MAPSTETTPAVRRQTVRELVCSFRPLRDGTGQACRLPTVALSDSRTVATTLAPLLMHEPVEVFAVACLSVRHRLLAWHIASRGTRSGALVSIPDVFLPACVTPGCVGIVALHNHPSGDPSPSPDDALLTSRLSAAATVLGIEFLDHIVIGEGDRYYSFREAGLLTS
ncbi:MAG: JAB domain-containing protein [Acidobacteria bacterium]|nr:JAB domain-containing protein [Acidobacteriota bacterium]